MNHRIPSAIALSAGTIILSVLTLNFITIPFGIGISSDSVNYLAASSSLIRGDGFLGYSGEPLAYWPPLFPVLLGVIRLFGLDPVNVMPDIQGLFLGATGALCICFMYRFSRSWPLSIFVGLVVIFSPYLVNVSSYLWSDIAYTFLMFSVILLTLFYVRQPNTPRLALLGIFCGLAFLQRYAGFSLVAAAGLCILVFGDRSIGSKARDLLLFGLTSCSLVFIWVLRNLIVTGTLSGRREFSPDYLDSAFLTSLNQIGAWFIPARFGYAAACIAGLSVICASALMVVYWLRKRQNDQVLDLAVIAIFIIIYFFFIVYAQLTACCADRFLAPLYPVLIVFVVGLVLFLIYQSGRHNRRWAIAMGGVAALGGASVVVINGSRTYAAVEEFREQGGGFNSQSWKNNSIIGELRKEQFDADVCMFSNAPDALAYFLDIHCIRWGPRRYLYYHDAMKIDERPKFVAEIKAMKGRNIFVWFNDWRPGRSFDAESLKDYVSVERLFRTKDGAVYEIQAKPK